MTLISYAPGRCDTCGKAIAKGQPFEWGAGKGKRVHPACKVTPPVSPTVTFEVEPKRIWSPFQLAGFHAVTDTTDNYIVEAVAGSGKTSFIEEACRRYLANNDKLTETPSILYLVFNKRNQLEAEGKMPAEVSTKTFHGAAWASLSTFLGRPRVDAGKTRKIFREMVDVGLISNDEADLESSVLKLVAYAKNSGVGVLLPETQETWYDLIDEYDVTFDADGQDVTPRGIEIARSVLQANNQQRSTVDFDDQLYLTVLLGVSVPQYQIVFVDEAQDTNPVQRALLRRFVAENGRLIAVGDRKQSIYRFRGASSNAMDLITNEWNARSLPLSVNYRCDKAIIAEAKPYCPQIEAFEGADEGRVVTVTDITFGDFQSTDVILSRTNAPIISLAYRFIKAGVPVRVRGRDIGLGLAADVRRFAGKRAAVTLDTVIDKAETYRDREYAKLSAKGDESKAQAVLDRVDSLLAIAESLPEENRTIAGLLDAIERLFSDASNDDTPMLTLSSIHRSKGLEYPRVFLLNRDKMPSKWARKAADIEQETNLVYVAITRAKHELLYITDESFVE